MSSLSIIVVLNSCKTKQYRPSDVITQTCLLLWISSGIFELSEVMFDTRIKFVKLIEGQQTVDWISYYSRTPLIRPPSESHWCGRIRGMVAREGFVYEEKPLSVTQNVVA